MPVDFEKLVEALMMAKMVSVVANASASARAGCNIEVDVEGCEYRHEGHRIVVKGKVLRGNASVVAFAVPSVYADMGSAPVEVYALDAMGSYGNVEITASVEVSEQG